MNKNDKILISSIFGMAIILAIFFYRDIFEMGSSVVVFVNGKEVASYSLEVDAEIPINEINKIKIDESKVSMIWANCPNQLCVQQRTISKVGETIVCLPNKVVIEVQGNGEKIQIDGVTN